MIFFSQQYPTREWIDNVSDTSWNGHSVPKAAGSNLDPYLPGSASSSHTLPRIQSTIKTERGFAFTIECVSPLNALRTTSRIKNSLRSLHQPLPSLLLRNHPPPTVNQNPPPLSSKQWLPPVLLSLSTRCTATSQSVSAHCL